MCTDKKILAQARFFQQQQGAATLVVAVVLLVIVLGISFFTAETVIMEKKITANEYRAKQAFHAAQAGIDYGISYIREDLDQNDDGVLDLSVASGGASGDVGNATFTIHLNDINGDMSLVEVESTGFSDDRLISRTISILLGKVPLLPNPPSVPVVAKSTIDVSGDMNVINLYTNLNIWTGDALNSWGSAETYIKDPAYVANMGSDIIDHMINNNIDLDDLSLQSTSKYTVGPDVVAGDVNLANASSSTFVENFFSKDIEGIKSSPGTVHMTGNELRNADSADVEGQVIYLSDAKLTGGSIGPRDNPVIIVADSPLDMTGQTDIFGIVIASSVNKIAGTVDIYGGLIAADTIDSIVGTANIYFDEKVIDNTGKFYEMEIVRGSWCDWCD